MFQKKLYQTIRAEGSIEKIEREGPFECVREDAWLGRGCYYWETFEEHAHWWGRRRPFKGNYFIFQTNLSIDRSKLYDLEDTDTLQEFFELKVELEKNYKNASLTVSFVLQYLRKKGLLNYCAVRARFIKGKCNIMYPIKGETPYMQLKPHIQICLMDKSVIGQDNYKMFFSSIPDYEGYI